MSEVSQTFSIELVVKCGDTVIVNGKRHRITSVGVRACGHKYHTNSPVEYYIASDGKELLAVLKQKGQHGGLPRQ